MQDNIFVKILSLFVLIVITSIVLYIFLTVDNGNKFGDQLTIANLEEYTKNKPSDKETIDHISFALLQTVNDNLDNKVSNNSVKDILIRDGSFKQSKDEKGIHSVEFIVDSKSLEQSYFITYQWADDKSVEVPEWGTAVKCLPSDKEVIFKDFKCKDMFSSMSSNLDSDLEKILPYNGDFFRITQYPDGDYVAISIQIMVNNNSSRTQARFDTHKKEAIKWLTDNKIELGKYRIDFRNLTNNIVSTQPRTIN